MSVQDKVKSLSEGNVGVLSEVPSSYKSSRYNFCWKAQNGDFLFFNGFSRNFAKINGQEEYEIIQELLLHPPNGKYRSQEEESLINDLIRGGFLVKENIDEFAILKARYRLSRYNNSGLGLTILVTTDCNFDCIYCFETKKRSFLNKHPEVQEAIVKLVEHGLRENTFLAITWFGGEPTLGLDSISKLTREFKRICEAKNCKYQAMLITNGYTLTRKIAKKCVELDISHVQITIDGPPEVHDKRRWLKRSHTGTFKRIVDNMKEIYDLLKIVVRVNVDKGNIQSIPSLLDIFTAEGLRGKIGVYFAPVMDLTEATADIAGTCFTDLEFAELEVKLIEIAREKGYDIRRYPFFRDSYCIADKYHSMVIDPEGNLYKCWNDATYPACSHGNILDDHSLKPEILLKWVLWDPLEKEECQNCEILPMCLGGCPFAGLHQMSEAERDKKGRCERWKYNLKLILEQYYLNYEKFMAEQEESKILRIHKVNEAISQV